MSRFSLLLTFHRLRKTRYIGHFANYYRNLYIFRTGDIILQGTMTVRFSWNEDND